MNADIVIECTKNGSKLVYDQSLGVEENFHWLKDNFKNVHFKGRLAAEVFVEHCDQSIKAIKSARRHNVLNYSCTLGKLCPFQLTIESMFDNASELSGYFYVKTIVLHNHSPDYRVLDHLSKTEEQIILLEREINSLTEEINACNQNIKDMQNKKSIQQWKITKKNKEMAKKKKEEKLKKLRELPAIESEFHRSYGFTGYSEKNESAYDKAYTSLQTHSLKAIQKYQARINNHKELVNAAKEYNRECDERADRTEPVVCNNDGFISYNISLNLPLTDLGRKLFAQKLYEGSFDMGNLNEY